jgi:apolipoprotein D and lipocalin family protein
MKKAFCFYSVMLFLVSCASSGPKLAPPEVVSHVDVARYIGRWYEIASFPQHFQKGCSDSRADYRLRDDGKIEVVNSCVRNGKVDSARGKAWVVDKSTNAKLKVSFFWPFRGDYWIIELGKDYEYAVVSSPNRKYLWILSRTPKMDEALYARIAEGLRERGFDVSLLRRTDQGNRKDP